MNKKYSRFVASLLLLFFVGVLVSQYIVRRAEAATLTVSKITISDSRSGHTGTAHTFNFTTATTATITTVTMQYCQAASGACVTPTGLVTTSAVQGSPTGIGASTSNVASNGTITLTVTAPASINSGTAITIPYTVITNPTVDNTTSYVRISTGTDSTTVAFAVLTSTSIAMTASVDPTFSFSVAGVSASGAVNSATTNITTTANTVPFGTLTSASPKIGALDTTVTTNALTGYTITISSTANPPLADGSNNLDSFTGTNTTPTLWSSPGGTSASVNTGFVGYTTNATNLSGTAARFSGNLWAGLGTTADEVVRSTVGISSNTVRVGLQAEVNALQPAGSYTGTVLLVATPTY